MSADRFFPWQPKAKPLDYDLPSVPLWDALNHIMRRLRDQVLERQAYMNAVVMRPMHFDELTRWMPTMCGQERDDHETRAE